MVFYSLDGGIPADNSLSVIRFISQNPVGIHLVVFFIRNIFTGLAPRKMPTAMVFILGELRNRLNCLAKCAVFCYKCLRHSFSYKKIMFRTDHEIRTHAGPVIIT